MSQVIRFATCHSFLFSIPYTITVGNPDTIMVSNPDTIMVGNPYTIMVGNLNSIEVCTFILLSITQRWKYSSLLPFTPINEQAKKLAKLKLSAIADGK